MNIQVVFPVLISFAISVILGPIVIPFLRRLKMGQTERVEGVQSHLKKAGYSDHGRCDLPDCSRSDDPVLCKGLSERDSGTVSDTGIWYHRFFG